MTVGRIGVITILRVQVGEPVHNDEIEFPIPFIQIKIRIEIY